MGWKAVMATRYELPYQAMSSRASKSVEILGMATLRMLVSRAMRKVPKNKQAVTSASRQPARYCAVASLEAMMDGVESLTDQNYLDKQTDVRRRWR